MATRNKVTWRRDSQGQFARQIGWKKLKSGKRGQHKFRLGADLSEAKRREARLQELWASIESGNSDPVWSEEALHVGKQIAKGDWPIKFARGTNEEVPAYAQRIHKLQQKYRMVPVCADDELEYHLGRLALEGSHNAQIQSHQVHSNMTRQFLTEGAVEAGIIASPDAEQVSMAGPRFHEVFDLYVEWIKKEKFDVELGRVKDGGLTIIRQINTLKERHADLPLGQVNYKLIEEMFRFWRQRPLRKGSTNRISPTSADNYLGVLKRFLKWVDQQEEIEWELPRKFDSISMNVEPDNDSDQEGILQVETFSLSELVELSRHATPLERAFLLLAINCGFGMKEISTLRVKDVVLFQRHRQDVQESLGYETTDADSFIKRIRRKSRVYGEWILFPQTVAALQWAMARRRKQEDWGKNALLFLNANGEPYDKPTKGSHRNQQIPNRFNAIIRRANAEGASIKSKSFGKLRKTGSNYFRNKLNDGEIASLYLCHGKPFDGDDLLEAYANRPFGRLFRLLRQFEEYLEPFFEAAGDNPFPQPGQPKKGL